MKVLSKVLDVCPALEALYRSRAGQSCSRYPFHQPGLGLGWLADPKARLLWRTYTWR